MDDRNNIENIWQDYHQKLYHFISTRVSGQPAIADDILQDVFIKVYNRIDTLKDDTKLQSWIYQITRNAIIDYYRSRKIPAELPNMLTEKKPEPFTETRQEIASWLQPMIQNLPEPYRETMLLSEINGLPHKVIAEQNGVSISGVKSRVQRGRKMVKEMLTDCCLFEFDHQGRVLDYDRKAENCQTC